jgi:hypothetical protein
MSAALWEWKYGDGRGCAVGARRSGRLVAHYGGTLRRVVIFGKEGVALQVCDAMVDRAERAVMTKSGVMHQVTATFLEIYQGLAGIPVAFGFPNARAMGLGTRLGLYAEVGAMQEVRWPALPARPRLRTRLRHVDPGRPEDREAVNRLWEAMRRDLSGALAVVRDWDYLAYRYLDHPEHRYEVLLVTSRLAGKLLGVLVLRRHATEVELLDFIAPLERRSLLVEQARRCAGLWGVPTVYCWMSRQHAQWLAADNGRVNDLDIRIPTNAWVRQDLTVAQLQDRWWLTSGDTDFH